MTTKAGQAAPVLALTPADVLAARSWIEDNYGADLIDVERFTDGQVRRVIALRYPGGLAAFVDTAPDVRDAVPGRPLGGAA